MKKKCFLSPEFWINNTFRIVLFSLGLSLLGNVYQYTYLLGYDKNVSLVTEAYEVEQLENFDLNRAIHEKNLIIVDLQYKLNECSSLIAIIEEEFRGLILVSHLIGDKNGKDNKENEEGNKER